MCGYHTFKFSHVSCCIIIYPIELYALDYPYDSHEEGNGQPEERLESPPPVHGSCHHMSLVINPKESRVQGMGSKAMGRGERDFCCSVQTHPLPPQPQGYGSRCKGMRVTEALWGCLAPPVFTSERC